MGQQIRRELLCWRSMGTESERLTIPRVLHAELPPAPEESTWGILAILTAILATALAKNAASPNNSLKLTVTGAWAARSFPRCQEMAD